MNRSIPGMYVEEEVIALVAMSTGRIKIKPGEKVWLKNGLGKNALYPAQLAGIGYELITNPQEGIHYKT